MKRRLRVVQEFYSIRANTEKGAEFGAFFCCQLTGMMGVKA